MYKKLISILIITILIAGSLVGCSNNKRASGNNSSNGKHITLTMWYWNRSVDDNIIKKVSKVFPNITIKATKIGGNYDSKVQTTMAAGSGLPDIFCINTNVADYFKYKDKILNLLEPPYNADKIKDQYFDWKWNMALTPDHKNLIAIPMDTGPTALFYRKDLFEKAGLPGNPDEVAKTIKTWQDYYDAAKKLKSINVYMFDNISDIFNMAMGQKQMLYLDNNNNFIGNRQEVKEVFDMAVNAHQLGFSANVGRGTNDWNAAMNNGKVASFVGAVWMKKILKDSAPDTSGKWRIAPAPGGPGNNGGSFMCISATTKYPKEAWEVIKWIQSPENQITALKEYDLFPAAKVAFDDQSIYVKEPFFGGQETNRIFADAAKSIPVFYYGPQTGNIGGMYTEQLNLIESQHKNPQKAWDDALNNIKKQYFSSR